MNRRTFLKTMSLAVGVTAGYKTYWKKKAEKESQEGE